MNALESILRKKWSPFFLWILTLLFVLEGSILFTNIATVGLGYALFLAATISTIFYVMDRYYD